MNTKKKNSGLCFYIALTEDRKEVKYFISGYFEEKEFTGVIHSYVKRFTYSQDLIYKNKYMPRLEDDNSEILDWESQVKIFDVASDFTLEQIETYFEEHIEYSTTEDNYVPISEDFSELEGILFSEADDSVICKLRDLSSLDVGSGKKEHIANNCWKEDELLRAVGQ